MLSLVENYLFPCISPLFFLPLSCPLFLFFQLTNTSGSERGKAALLLTVLSSSLLPFHFFKRTPRLFCIKAEASKSSPLLSD